LTVTPNPLVFKTNSGNEAPITLAAAGPVGDEIEIIEGGISAIEVTEGPAGWVQLNGSNCASKKLKVGGPTCVEQMKDVKFPTGSEIFRAKYEVTWKSIIPPEILLRTTEVKLRAEK
jgi:hypothetical protein